MGITQRTSHDSSKGRRLAHAASRLKPPIYKELHAVHLLATASQAMRRVLIDHARATTAVRRQRAQRQQLELNPASSVPDSSVEILSLNGTIYRVVTPESRRADCQNVFSPELRVDEIAELCGASELRSMRDWKMAGVWPNAELTNDPYGAS